MGRASSRDVSLPLLTWKACLEAELWLVNKPGERWCWPCSPALLRGWHLKCQRVVPRACFCVPCGLRCVPTAIRPWVGWRAPLDKKYWGLSCWQISHCFSSLPGLCCFHTTCIWEENEGGKATWNCTESLENYLEGSWGSWTISQVLFLGLLALQPAEEPLKEERRVLIKGWSKRNLSGSLSLVLSCTQMHDRGEFRAALSLQFKGAQSIIWKEHAAPLFS